MRSHFDGNGRKILGYFAMRSFYACDLRSLAVLRAFAPSRYIVVPDVEIRLKKGVSDDVDVILTWPGGSTLLCKKRTERRIEALRRLYSSGDTLWRIENYPDRVVFRRRGCLVEKIDAVRYSDSSA